MKKIKEEYAFYDMEDYLKENIDLLIAGFPGEDERSKFFYDKWNGYKKTIFCIKSISNGKIEVNIRKYTPASFLDTPYTVDLIACLKSILKNLPIKSLNVLIDLSSLEHEIIIYLTKLLLKELSPASLFATYIRPRYYTNVGNTLVEVGSSLSEQILGIRSVAGFARTEKPSQTLCSFIGFEACRLRNILEYVNDIDKVIPVVAFPAGDLQWYNTTMWNSLDILQSECDDNEIHKCFSESIFSAYFLMEEYLNDETNIVLAPLGTRAHSMACAIYASRHNHARIIYDYAIENKRRAEGIANITVYHLSSFLNS